MEKSKKSIPQTNRTILFEEINPERSDLLTLLSAEPAVSLDDDKISEINRILLVKSFDQFIERFQPKIYGVFDIIAKKMKFTLKRPSVNAQLIKEIPLNCENGFLGMILDLMNEHIEKQKSNQVFHFERMLDIMLPEQAIEQLKETRAELLTRFRSYAEIPQQEKERKERAFHEVRRILDGEFYQYHDLLSLLPLAMDDLKRKLFPEGRKKAVWNPIVDGISNMVERDLRILDLPQQGELAVSDLREADRQKLKHLLLEYCRNHLKYSGSYVEHLILRTYGLEPGEDVPDMDQLADQYNKYLEFYTESFCSLIETAKPVIEKILGVKAFFDQYQVDQREMEPELLVTNVNNDLWIDYQKTERLHAFLNTINCKINYEHTIWFAILPNLTFPPDKAKKLSRVRFQGNTVRNIARTNSMTLAANLMNVLSQYQIQTFFSFECDESTTFSYTALYGTDHYEDGCNSFAGRAFSEYAIPCFPNFTLIPKEKSYLTTGRKIVATEVRMMEYSSQKEDLYRIWIGGIHIEASYVAAGLTAAWQCPEYLKERYRKEVLEEEPGVRYDIERDDHWLRTVTTMGREITGYKEDILAESRRRRFGFFFSSENHMVSPESRNTTLLVNHSTVLSARSLGKKHGRYEPIFRVLTANYIERMLRYQTFDYKKSEIIHFFKNYSNSTVSKWRAGSKQINGILQRDDQLSYQLDEKNNLCILEIAFEGDIRTKEIDLTPLSVQQGGELIG